MGLFLSRLFAGAVLLVAHAPSMIRKRGIRFSATIMLNENLERDADPTMTHSALVA
jgi:hypothetical protein